MNDVQKILIVLALLLSAVDMSAQQAIVERYVDLALLQNPTVLAARLSEDERRLAVDLASANYLPTVDFKTDYFLAAGGRTIAFPVGDLLNPAYAVLNQLAGTDRFPTDLENVNELLSPNNFYDARFEARLPLLEPRIKREIALREQQLTESGTATEVVRNEIRREVRNLYYSYLLAVEGAKIIDSSRAVLSEVLRVNRVLVENQKITVDAIYRTEAEIAQLDGRTANFDQQRDVAAAALNRLLGRPISTPLEETDPGGVQLPIESVEELRLRALRTASRAPATGCRNP